MLMRSLDFRFSMHRNKQNKFRVAVAHKCKDEAAREYFNKPSLACQARDVRCVSPRLGHQHPHCI